MSGPAISAQPRTLWQANHALVSATGVAAGDYVFGYSGTQAIAGVSSARAASLIQITPGDLELYDKNTYLRLRLRMWSTDANPNVSVYISLYKLGNVTGTVQNTVAVLGAEVAGSRTPTYVWAAANTDSGLIVGPEFAVPAEGLYLTICHINAAMAANTAFAYYAALDALSR